MPRDHPSPGSSGPLAKLIVDLAAWQIGACFVALGVLALYLSGVWEGPNRASPVDATVREIGALLFVTGALSVFWDLRGRRALMGELLAAADLSSDIANAGLKRIARRYLDVEWDQLLDGAAHVDLFFAYARTWRATHAMALRRLAERDGTRLRVILPDKNNTALIDQLAAKFRYSADQLIQHITEAESDFDNLRTQANGHGTVEIRLTREFPVYTYYRLDRRCIVVLYSQAPGRVDIPAFECDQGGSLSAFFRDQFEKLWKEASVRHLREDLSK
jgi:hypothetical protein